MKSPSCFVAVGFVCLLVCVCVWGVAHGILLLFLTLALSFRIGVRIPWLVPSSSSSRYGALSPSSLQLLFSLWELCAISSKSGRHSHSLEHTLPFDAHLGKKSRNLGDIGVGTSCGKQLNNSLGKDSGCVVN